MFIAKVTKIFYIENENTHVVRYAKEALEFIRRVDITKVTQAAIADDPERALDLLIESVGKTLKAYHFMTWVNASLDDFHINYTITEVVDGLFDDYLLTSSTNERSEKVLLGGKLE